MRTLVAGRGGGGVVGGEGEEGGKEHWLLLGGSNRGAHEMALLGHPALRESAPPGCSAWPAAERSVSQALSGEAACCRVLSCPRSASPPRPTGAEAVTQAIPATAYIG